MTCKDCLHNGVCRGFTPTDLDKDVFDYCREGRADEIPDIEDRCNEFENKTDFVEVVRCRDCKYFGRIGTIMTVCKHDCNTIVTESAPKRVNVLAVREDHYCGYGISVAEDFISNFPSNERLGEFMKKILSSEREGGNGKPKDLEGSIPDRIPFPLSNSCPWRTCEKMLSEKEKKK